MQMVARPRSVGAAVLLHFLHWLLGAVEVWIVLHAMGLSVGPCQAIIMNAIGQAARSAGFAVPGSLVVQESGFMLGATLAGLPPQSALVFSLIRRVRELVIGGVGVCTVAMQPAAGSGRQPAGSPILYLRSADRRHVIPQMTFPAHRRVQTSYSASAALESIQDQIEV